MGLHGTAFIAIWHGLVSGSEHDFERWHTEEHMPERLGVPGFLRGTRYIHWAGAPHVCFTRYELAHVEVFRSPAYLARLNAPTPWSNRVQPCMRDFLRVVCENLVSIGRGTSGAITTGRIGVADPSDLRIRRDLCHIVLDLLESPGLTTAHLGRQEAGSADQRTSESALRPPFEATPFDYVLMLEAVDRKKLEKLAPALERRLLDAGATSVDLSDFDLAFQLEAPR